MRKIVLALAAFSLIAAACANSSTTAASSGSGAAAPPATAADCAKQNGSAFVNPGHLTVATDDPVYSPWFRHNDPTNQQGYESAVAYAVAQQLGFTPDQVTWVR